MVKVTVASKINSLYHGKDTSFKYVQLCYKVIHIMLGLNFGFIKVKCFKYKYISPVSVTIQCSFYMILAGNLLLRGISDVFGRVWYIAFFVRYYVYAIMLSFIKEELTFCNLFHDLRTIDLGLKVNHASYNLEVKLLLIVFTFLCFRLSITLSYCLYFNIVICELKWNAFVYFFTYFAMDILLTTCAFMFYAINCRLKKLTMLVMAENSDFISKQYLYKSIVDIAEQHKAAISPVVSYCSKPRSIIIFFTASASSLISLYT